MTTLAEPAAQVHSFDPTTVIQAWFIFRSAESQASRAFCASL